MQVKKLIDIDLRRSLNEVVKFIPDSSYRQSMPATNH